MTDKTKANAHSSHLSPEVAEDDIELELSQAVRLELFMSHACYGVYGDDGEMQCNVNPAIDFKRNFPSEILAKCAIHRLIRAQLAAPPVVNTDSSHSDYDDLLAAYPDARIWEHAPGDWRVAAGSTGEIRTYGHKTAEDAIATAARRIRAMAKLPASQPDLSAQSGEQDRTLIQAVENLFSGGFIEAGCREYSQWDQELEARLIPLRVALNAAKLAAIPVA
jgi:hypothetical protein